ncbi:MAG: hypothetical protein M3383_06855 [Actinomycetota bacterium]|nr:hypothetical protein [Actinomycetota bacterium]
MAPEGERTTAERLYRGTTRAFAVVICVFGALMVALTLARGGGLGALGLWLGLVFVALGCARLYLSFRA